MPVEKALILRQSWFIYLISFSSSVLLSFLFAQIEPTRIGGDLKIYQRYFTFESYRLGNYFELSIGANFWFNATGEFLTISEYLIFHKALFYCSLTASILLLSRRRLWLLPFILVFLYAHDPYLTSYADFILKQGLGFIFLFIFQFYHMDSKKTYTAATVAFFFHYIFFITAVIFFISKYINKINGLFIIVFFAMTAYVTNFPMLFVDIFIEFLPDTYEKGSHYKLGFKLPFFLASFWIYILFMIPNYYQIVKTDLKLFRLWSFYTVGILFSCMLSGLPYHDRIFVLFWACQYFIMFNFFCRLSGAIRI